MSSDLWLTISGRHIVHEDFGGEVVVVNLKTGTYYGLNGTAAAIWQMIGGGLSAAQIAERFAAHYSGQADAARTAVAGFLDELQREALIHPAAQPPAAAAGAPAALPAGPLTPPAVQRCTDMEELLVLDPVHEVDAMGWPARPTTAE
jgi:hypothetical protein